MSGDLEARRILCVDKSDIRSLRKRHRKDMARMAIWSAIASVSSFVAAFWVTKTILGLAADAEPELGSSTYPYVLAAQAVSLRFGRTGMLLAAIGIVSAVLGSVAAAVLQPESVSSDVVRYGTWTKGTKP